MSHRTHTDGTRILHSESDTRGEDAVAAAVGAAWGCQIRRFALLSPVDWYAVRHERVIGVAELKRSRHPSGSRPNALLSVRKWLALSMASAGLNVGAAFVVACPDAILWISITAVESSRVRLGGRRDRGLQNDIEPVIDVPVSTMNVIHLPSEGPCDG